MLRVLARRRPTGAALSCLEGSDSGCVDPSTGGGGSPPVRATVVTLLISRCKVCKNSEPLGFLDASILLTLLERRHNIICFSVWLRLVQRYGNGNDVLQVPISGRVVPGVVLHIP